MRNYVWKTITLESLLSRVAEWIGTDFLDFESLEGDIIR